MMAVLAGCSSIDDNLDGCGEQAQMDYELKLVTNVSTEVQTQLNAVTDLALVASLRDYLGGIFTDFAKDVNLSFYAVGGNMGLLLDGVENCMTATLRQVAGDTIESHNTGIFTARQYMEMIEGIDQTFNVKLYMANCSAMLAVDPQGHDISRMQVFATGFATAFHIADSVYEYTKPAPMIRTKRLEPDENGYVGFVSVNFPSPEPSAPQPAQAMDGSTRSVIETTDPFIAQPGEEVLWEFHIFLRQDDGTITKTVLGIKEPLRAGQFKIVKVRIGEKGQVEPESPTVGVSVTLDWKPGGTYNPDL